MTGDLEKEAALDHPGNAVVKPLTVGFDPWEAHELGGDENTTNSNSVTINHIELGIISTFRPVPLRPPFMSQAVMLGADPRTWSRSQFVRLPGGLRLGEKRSRQNVFYLNPQNAVTL